MKLTILITGGTGFLGSYVIKKLLSMNIKIILLKRTTSNIFRIKDYINKCKVYDIEKVDIESIFAKNELDIVLHMATDYGRKEENVINLVEINLMLPLKLLSLCKKYEIKNFINTDTILDKRINSYTLSKDHFKNWLKYFSNEIVSVNILLEHFYGPGDDLSKFTTFIIHNLIKNTDKLNLTLGEQKRDFIFIDDVVDAIILIINNLKTQKDFYQYEIGSGINTSIKDFVLKVAKISGNTSTKLNFGALAYRENEVMQSVVNNKEIIKLGWAPKISLDEGIQKTINSEKDAS